MRIVEYSYIKRGFPFIFNSKFLVNKFNEQPFIKTLEISLNLNNKQRPEMLFWILFSLNKKKSFVQFKYKKKYLSGRSSFNKNFLNISKKFGSKKNVTYFVNILFHNVLLYSKEVNFTQMFPLRPKTDFRVFKFYEIKFADKYNGLINLAPKNWLHYNLKFLIKPKFYNGFHFRFFLQNLQLPII